MTDVNIQAHEEHEFLTAENAEIAEVFGRLCVRGKFCSKSKLLPQSIAFVHKAIETAFFRSQLKTVLICRKDAQKGDL